MRPVQLFIATQLMLGRSVSVLGRELLRRMSDIVAWLHSPLLLFKGMQGKKWPFVGRRNWHSVVGAVAEAHTQAKQQEWSCQNGFIQVVDRYSYLGTCLDTSLSVQSMIQHRADIGKHALAPLVSLLVSAKIPTRIKTMVIKAILIPKSCYGAEIWGSQSLT